MTFTSHFIVIFIDDSIVSICQFANKSSL